MGTLQKIVKVTQQQYDSLKNGGTIGGYTGINNNYIYLVQEDYDDITYANLNSTTSLGTIDQSPKLYAVGLDSNRNLCVKVPWSSVTIDTSLSSSSTNPPQNKAVYSAFSSAVGFDSSYYAYGERGSWRMRQYNNASNSLDIRYGVITITSQSATYDVSFSKNFDNNKSDYTVVFGLYRQNKQNWFWSPIVQDKTNSGFKVFVRGNASGDNGGTLMYLAIRSN